MTSKEAIDELIECAKFDLNKWELERLGIIDKDLEVLEILRKYVYFSNQSGCVRMKDIYKRTVNFDYEELREWLENEKN